MTFNLDLALFYAYTLTLFAFVALWLLPQLLRALLEGAETWINAQRGEPDRAKGDRMQPPTPDAARGLHPIVTARISGARSRCYRKPEA